MQTAMPSKAPTITLSLLIEMLEEVMKESGPREPGRIEASAWNRGTLIDETGFNSYDFVELIFKIEDRFGIEVDYNANNSINDVKTIGGLCDEIGKLLANKQAA